MDNIQTRVTLDDSLNALTDDLVRLSSKIDTAIEQSVQAYSNCDIELAQQIMVTQQPVAGDMRMIVTGMNIVTELERMGDHAAGIARLAVRVEEVPKRDVPGGIFQISTQCRDMLRRSVEAFIQRDASKAYAVAANDDNLDTQYRLLFHKTVAETRDASKSTDHLLSVLFVAHNLERIGDRATNIAERVIFMTSGKLTELNVYDPE